MQKLFTVSQLYFKKLGRLDQAETNYFKAINLKPNFVLAYNNLGSTLEKLGKLDEAVTI